MENCVSKGNIEIIIKKSIPSPFFAEERLTDGVYGSEDQLGDNELKRRLDDIDELCK